MNNIVKLSLINLFLIVASCSKEKNCADFKTGEFRYTKEGMLETIVRTENMQIETNLINKVVVKTSIEWTSDCEYILTYNEILNHPLDMSNLIGNKIYCEIVETNGTRLKVHAKSDTMDDVIEFIKIY
ncbi:hypothetical protein [Algibacter sp. L4_22]|uniref:hypothetical protein n=1 Tax=Algibacter sp. L4_22 TaxID=2942477 RepID=UPI00201B9795|nr:hypothetical protein [Algibacter sp. L4_22]MCL5128004.1 hypothetical protein [Algibacter sp. L4_22]